MTVYVVQDQRRYDKDSGEFVQKFDLSPAEEHGQLRYLLTPTASPFNPASILPELQEALRDFSDDDHLLLVGNPVLIGWAMAIAADYNGGCVSALQWSGKERCYLAVKAQVFEIDEDRDDE